jgi:hypothetical protein
VNTHTGVGLQKLNNMSFCGHFASHSTRDYKSFSFRIEDGKIIGPRFTEVVGDFEIKDLGMYVLNVGRHMIRPEYTHTTVRIRMREKSPADQDGFRDIGEKEFKIRTDQSEEDYAKELIEYMAVYLEYAVGLLEQMDEWYQGLPKWRRNTRELCPITC